MRGCILCFMVASILVRLLEISGDSRFTDDRFHGFRFKFLIDSENDIDNVIDAADQMNCFGWIQVVDTNSAVGEMRCAIFNGKTIFESMKSRYSSFEAKVTSAMR